MTLDIHFLDVGQGDATFLRFDAADGLPRFILMDAGAAARGPRVVEYLRREGVRRLHLVVASHMDDDHIAGLADVLTQFPVARFWGPDPGSQSIRAFLAQNEAAAQTNPIAGGDSSVGASSVSTYARLLALALSRGALVEHPVMGYDGSYLFPGLTLRVMGPVPSQSHLISTQGLSSDQILEIQSTETNNASIVLRVGLDGQFVLLPGDAELGAWRAMIGEWGAGLHARVLKLSHHGSANGANAAVLEAVRPREAVISVGANSYGHPAPQVLELLAPPIELYRTDRQGDIIIRFGAEPAVPPDGRASWWQRLVSSLMGWFKRR